MSDTQDHEKTTFVRAPAGPAETPDTQAEPAVPHDQTVMMKASPRAREAAAALSAEREAKRSQPLPPPDRGPALDSVDFDVTAGFGDEAPVETGDFIDITQGAYDAAPARSPLPPSTPTSPPTAATAGVPTAGGTGKLMLVAVILAAMIAAGLWFVTR